MKIFIVGLPKSGRTTVAQQLVHELIQERFNPRGLKCFYLGAMDWIKNTFRTQSYGETSEQFNEEYHNYLINRLQNNPDIVISNLLESICSLENQAQGHKCNWVIDGIVSPRDFCRLFDYNQDVVVFLNRTDSELNAQDYESIGVSVMRDYCFWLASANLLSKPRWIEYNFKIPGEHSDSVKTLGSKNSVFIVKSIDKVIDHLVGLVTKLLG